MSKNLDSIPEFFNDTNYKVFLDLDADEIYSEIEHRRRTIIPLLEKIEAGSVDRWVNADVNAILNGNPQLTGASNTVGFISIPSEEIDKSKRQSDLAQEQFTELFEQLAFNPSMQPLSVGDINSLFYSQKRLLDEASEHINTLQNDAVVTSSTFSIVDNNMVSFKLGSKDKDRNYLNVKINLEHFSDKQIIEHLKQSLPEWRKQLNAKTGQHKNIRVEQEERILKFKLIQLFDLKMWETINSTKILDEVICAKLFPNEDLEYYTGQVKRAFERVFDHAKRYPFIL